MKILRYITGQKIEVGDKVAVTYGAMGGGEYRMIAKVTFVDKWPGKDVFVNASPISVEVITQHVESLWEPGSVVVAGPHELALLDEASEIEWMLKYA